MATLRAHALVSQRLHARRLAERGGWPRLELAFALCLLQACGAPLTTHPSNATADAHGADDPLEVVGRRDASADGQQCPVVSEPRPLGRVTTAEVNEASGLAQSSLNPGVLWIHNDSGDSGRVFAIDRTGAWRGTVRYTPVDPEDVEDLALMEDAGTWYLLLGDIGDNPAERASLRIYRFA